MGIIYVNKKKVHYYTHNYEICPYYTKPAERANDTVLFLPWFASQNGRQVLLQVMKERFHIFKYDYKQELNSIPSWGPVEPS